MARDQTQPPLAMRKLLISDLAIRQCCLQVSVFKVAWQFASSVHSFQNNLVPRAPRPMTEYDAPSLRGGRSMWFRLRTATVLLMPFVVGFATVRAETASRPAANSTSERVMSLHLERYGIEPTASGMAKGLQDPRLPVRQKCIEGLGLIGGESEVADVKAACEDPVTPRSAFALVRLSLMCDRLPQDRQPALRSYIVDTANLTWSRRTGSLGEIAEIAAAVEFVGGPPHADAFLAAMKEPSSRGMGLFHLRASLSKAKADGRPPAIDWVPALRAALVDKASTAFARMEAAECLAAVGGKSAEDALRAAFVADKDLAVRKRIEICLQRIGRANKSAVR
jgi:hypothetical protein